ncbi:MAG: hypothetical protein QXH42_04405 [Thermoplasmata archaeon]
MEIMNKSWVPAALILLLLVWTAPTASAGDENLPEIKDGAGDSASGKSSRDILTAWFHDETNESIEITLHTSSLELYTEPSEIPNLPTQEYEVYFTLGESSYAVVCRVPVHGPFGLTIQFGLNSVVYGSGPENVTETSKGTLSGCSYNPGNSTIHWVLPKDSLDNPGAGTRLTGTWAGVWNRNFADSERRLEDRAPNSGFGLDYIIRGSTGGEVLKLEMSADNTTKTCRPGEPATYRLTLFNNGTTTLNVSIINSTMSEGWNCTLSQETLTILNGSSRVVTVYISCPRTAKNGTVETTRITANIQAGGISGPPSTVTLTTTVFYIPPKTIETTNPFFKFLNSIRGNPAALYSIAALIIIALVGGAGYGAVRHRRKKKELRAAAAG